MPKKPEHTGVTRSGRLKNRSALITGASRGIGLAIAAAFAKEGADLSVTATELGHLAEVERVVASVGQRIQLQALDVSDREGCFRAVKLALDAFGKIDILVNNAGYHKMSRFVDHSLQDFDRTLKVNLYGPFNMMQAVVPHMVERGYGKIINLASIAGKWAAPSQSAYNASKHGLIGLTRCVALETAGMGLTVNAICPGIVETDMGTGLLAQRAELEGVSSEAVRKGLLARVPAGRFLQASEVADLAVYLASRESDGMTGQSITLDGGMLFI